VKERTSWQIVNPFRHTDSLWTVRRQYKVSMEVGPMLVDFTTSGFEPGDYHEEDFSLLKNPKCRKGRSSILDTLLPPAF
jgi:hypothetical protein